MNILSLIRSLTFARSDNNFFVVICFSVSSDGFRNMIVSLGGGTCTILVSILGAGTITVVSSTLGVGHMFCSMLGVGRSTLGVGNGFRSTLGGDLSTLGVGTVIDLSAVGFGTLVVSGAF